MTNRRLSGLLPELDRMHVGEFAGSAGRVVQRTETTPRQRAILKALDIAEPRLVLDVATASEPRRRVKKRA